MKCFECGGELLEQKASLVFYKKDKSPVFFEGVQVDECGQCGEKYVSGAVSEKISGILESEMPDEVDYLKVPVVHIKD